jgi:hypothetical protein
MTIPVIIPPEGTLPEKPYSIVLSSNVKSGTVIDTREPINHSALFRPVRDLQQVSCPPDISLKNGTPRCYRYLTAVYADYQASPDASVTITSTLTGNNSWKIFEPGSNQYSAVISLEMVGENRGWKNVNGFLQSCNGKYDAPDI